MDEDARLGDDGAGRVSNQTSEFAVLHLGRRWEAEGDQRQKARAAEQQVSHGPSAWEDSVLAWRQNEARHEVHSRAPRTLRWISSLCVCRDYNTHFSR